jgi:hypothetical protein
MAPQVENLSDIIARLNAQYDPLRAQAQQQVGNAQTMATQAEAGINAQKNTAFQTIDNTANSRGVLFSGFTPDQQAKYTAGTYLPALVNLHAKTQDNITKLQSSILALNQQQNSQAEGIRNGQQATLAQYQTDQQKLAQQLAIAQMNNQAKLQAASISAGAKAPKTLTAAQQRQTDANALYTQLQKVAGRDGFISPADYAKGLSLWNSAGYTQKDFDAIFAGLRNPNNKHYKLSSGWGS